MYNNILGACTYIYIYICIILHIYIHIPYISYIYIHYIYDMSSGQGRGGVWAVSGPLGGWLFCLAWKSLKRPEYTAVLLQGRKSLQALEILMAAWYGIWC